MQTSQGILEAFTQYLKANIYAFTINNIQLKAWGGKKEKQNFILNSSKITEKDFLWYIQDFTQNKKKIILHKKRDFLTIITYSIKQSVTSLKCTLQRVQYLFYK